MPHNTRRHSSTIRGAVMEFVFGGTGHGHEIRQGQTKKGIGARLDFAAGIRRFRVRFHDGFGGFLDLGVAMLVHLVDGP